MGLTEQFSEQIKQAASEQTPLRIQGSASKAFYGRAVPENHQLLSMADYSGIVSYEPTELTITAKAGTTLSELEQTLAKHGQMLAFEPPYFGPGATLGGTIACGLSGPRRPYAGAARDFVLGVKMINGRGEILNFGGQVMKNVAGYDVSRLLTGSLGTLGLILEVSLKVLPLPAQEITLTHTRDEKQAIAQFNEWAGKPYPISAAAYHEGILYLRLSGATSAVESARAQLGGDELSDAQTFWSPLREHKLPFFVGDQALWRVSIPPATGSLRLPGTTLLDWGGAQRWLRTEIASEAIFAAAKGLGGHACLFRGGDRQSDVFQPLDPVVKRFHQQLKLSFDPQGIFNLGRMYSDF